MRQHRTIRRLRPRTWAGRLGLIAVAGLVARVAYVLIVMPHVELGFDSIWYGFQSNTIASGVGFVDVEYYFQRGEVIATASFPPLWPALLAVVNKLGADSERAFELVGAVLGTGTIVLAGFVGRRVAGPAAGLVAAALVAASPALIAADGSLMSESVFVLLMTGAVLVAYMAALRPTVLRWAALGVVLGVAALARSDALLLAPILVGVVAWRLHASVTRRFALALVALVALAIVLTPWTIRTSNALGEVVLLSSNSGSLLEGANCASTYGGKLMGLWDPRCLKNTRRPGLTEAASTRRAREHAVDFARDHLGKLPAVATVRLLRVAGLYEPVTQARGEAIESRNAVWQVVAWGYWIVLLPFAVAGAVLLRRRHADLGPILALVVGVLVVGVLSWGNQRFRLAAEPVVLVLAGAGVIGAVRTLRTRFSVAPS